MENGWISLRDKKNEINYDKILSVARDIR